MRVEDTIPEGFDPPELAEEPQLTAPGIDPELQRITTVSLRNGASRIYFDVTH